MKDFKLRFYARKCGSPKYSVIDICVHLKKDVDYLGLIPGTYSFLVKDCKDYSTETVENVNRDNYVESDTIFWLYKEQGTLFIRESPEAYRNGWWIEYDAS